MIPKSVVVAFQAILLSAIFFLVLFLIVVGSNQLLPNGKIKIENIHIFISLVPFFIMLILSDKLKEIKGPGGIGLSMRDEASKSLAPQYEDETMEVNPEVTLEKGGEERLKEAIDNMRTTTLSLTVGKEGYYNQEAINYYIHELEKKGKMNFIIFVDSTGEFRGFMDVKSYKQFEGVGNVVRDLETGKILNHSDVTTHSINLGESNKNALNLMDKSNSSRLAVIDSRRKFVGVTTQDEIVRKILSKVITEA